MVTGRWQSLARGIVLGMVLHGGCELQSVEREGTLKQAPEHAIGTGPGIDSMLTGRMEAHPLEPPGRVCSGLKGFMGPVSHHTVTSELTYYITKI